jgi:hypothetical protein
MFYDLLSDGFVDLAMEFYDDPFGFDINAAKARREAGDDAEANRNGREGAPRKGTSEYPIELPNKELDARVEESL